MSVARSVENAAETVAALSGTIADAADTVDEVVKTGRNLLKKLIVGFIIVTAIAVIVKMVKDNTAAEPASYEPPVAVPESQAPVVEAGPVAADDSAETDES